VCAQGHPELCADAEGALWLADGALVAVDATEGVLCHTERLLRSCAAMMAGSVQQAAPPQQRRRDGQPAGAAAAPAAREPPPPQGGFGAVLVLTQLDKLLAAASPEESRDSTSARAFNKLSAAVRSANRASTTGGGGCGGEWLFLGAHWVAVPEALRARRVNGLGGGGGGGVEGEVAQAAMMPMIGPERCVFASPEEGWGFCLRSSFAPALQARFGLGVEEMTRRLWGANHWDHEWGECDPPLLSNEDIALGRGGGGGGRNGAGWGCLLCAAVCGVPVCARLVMRRRRREMGALAQGAHAR
jgi:hypothetical protein